MCASSHNPGPRNYLIQIFIFKNAQRKSNTENVLCHLRFIGVFLKKKRRHFRVVFCAHKEQKNVCVCMHPRTIRLLFITDFIL